MIRNHTPEPWQLARLDLDRCRVEIETVERGDDLPDQGYSIAVCYSGATDEGPNAHRIVECVNGCGGVINPSAIPDAIKALEDATDCAWDYAATHGEHPGCIDRARAALKALKGES